MTREEAITVFKAFMDNPLFSDVHKAAFSIAIHDIKQRHDWDINELMLVPKTEWEQESTTKNDLGVDAVSRKAVINQIFYSTDNNGDVVLGSALRERIARLPSVTPQEPILDKIFCIAHPLSIMSTPELEHKAIMQIAEMLEPLCLPESEDKE